MNDYEKICRAGRQDRLAELEAMLAAKRELLDDINEFMLGAVLGTTKKSEVLAMLKDMAAAYRAKIEETEP